MFALQCEHVGSVLCGWNRKHIDHCDIKAADKPDSESDDEPATKQNKLMMKRKNGKPQKFELDGSDSDMDDHAPSKTLSDEENDITRNRVTAKWFHANEPRLSEDH